MKFEIVVKVIYADKISDSERDEVEMLDRECFSDVDPKSLKEDFIAVPFGYITARKGGNLVGKIDLFKRIIVFSSKKVVLGGLGGVCVKESERRQGIGLKMCLLGVKTLMDEKCDVACLNADLDKDAYKIYQEAGFKFMERKITFENIKGEIVFDDGTMFMPLNFKVIFNFIMNSKQTFHYGRGYW